MSESHYDEKLNELLNLSVERHLISDVPVGVLLSGGLDSSLLSAIAAKKINNVQTFSLSFNEKKYDESEKAKIVSDYIGYKHLDVVISKENFLKNLQEIITVRDTPVSIPHEYPLFLLNKEIKKTIKVVLSGEGADEFFGGYSRVQKSPYDFYKGIFIQKNLNNSFIKKLLSIDRKFNFADKNFLDFFFHRYNWFKFNEIDDLLNEDIKRQVNKDCILEPWKSNK